MARADRTEPMTRNPDLLRRGEPFAQALRTLRLTGVLASTVAIGPGPWATSMPHAEDCIILYFVTKGRCVGGTFDPRELVELHEGDVLLLPRPGRCMLAESPGLTPVPLEDLLERELGNVEPLEEKWRALFAAPFRHHLSQGQPLAVGLIALRMFFDQGFPAAILDGLLAVIRLRDTVSRHRAFIETLLAQIIEQGEQGLSGQDTATRLAEALLVHCLSRYLMTVGEGRPGFLRGLKDPYLAKVIGAIQSRPGAKWTLQQMARSAGLSRSGFAERFRATLGMTPAQFLTAVRMARATDLLLNGKTAIARIAEQTGYGSEAAFNRAFRKWSGSPPRNSTALGILRGCQSAAFRTRDHLNPLFG